MKSLTENRLLRERSKPYQRKQFNRITISTFFQIERIKIPKRATNYTHIHTQVRVYIEIAHKSMAASEINRTSRWRHEELWPFLSLADRKRERERERI